MNMQKETEKDVLSVVEPPYGNTGVLPTNKKGLRALIDWVAFTFTREDFTVENICDLLNVNYADFIQVNGKMMGYNSHIYYSGITIHYGGNKGMGIHVEISGQGCRHYENGNGKYGRPWDELFMDILDFKGHFTRIDVAIDDTKGYFRIPRVVGQIKKGRLVSKFKWAKVIENIRILDGKVCGTTIYYGRPSSSIQIRMYEKDHERRMNGKDVSQKITCWNRTEIQARDERAHAIARLIVSGQYPLGHLISGILREYLRFVNQSDSDTNKWRWPISPWWDTFTQGVQNLSLSLVAPDMTIEKKATWLFSQTSKTLAQVWFAFENDPDMFMKLVEEGYLRMKPRDWQLVEQFKEESHKFDDFFDLVRKFSEWNEDKKRIEREIKRRKMQLVDESIEKIDLNKKNNPQRG
jgi:phage replication initiation protein